MFNKYGNTREINGDFDIRQRIYDTGLFATYLCTNKGGDCVNQSLRLVMKLKKAGGVRVRGKRESERQYDTTDNTNKNYHYWVENRGYVFEESCGIQQIYKQEEFNKIFKPSNIEYAEFGIWFKDEIPDGSGNIVRNLTDPELHRLIDIYSKK